MMGRRVVITGVAEQVGVGARAAARARSRGRVPRSGSTASRRRADLERTEFIEADIRNPVLSRILPGDRGRHRRPLRDPLVPGARQAGAGPARHQRDRHAPAARRLRAHRRRSSGWSSAGSAAIYGCEGPAPYFFTEDLARRMPLRTRFQRDIAELENYFSNFARRHSGVDLLHAPLPARDRPRARHAASAATCRCRWSRRSSASTRGCSCVHAEDATGALLGGGPQPGPRRRSTSRPAARSRSAGRCGSRAGRRCRSRIRCSSPRSARLGDRLGAGTLYGDAVRFLRFGRGVDNRRLREEVGYEPAFDAEGTVRDFAARLRGPQGRARPSPGRARRSARGSACGDRRRAGGRAAPEARRRLPAPAAPRGRGRPRPAERRGGRGLGAPRPDPAARSRCWAGGSAASTTRTSGDSTRSSPRRSTRCSSSCTTSGGGSRPTGVRNVPAHGRALLVVQPRRLAVPVRRLDDPRGDHEGAPAAAVGPLHGPRLGLRAAVPVVVHAAGRRRPGEPLQRDPAARAGRAGDGLPGGRQGNREAVLRALPAAALRPRRLRRDRAADRLADRPGRRRRLRGDLPEARREPRARARDRRAVRADHADLPLARRRSA